MSSDPTYSTKIRMDHGGDRLDVAPGGIISANGAQGAFVAPAATASTNASPYGFSQAQADALVAWVIAVDTQLKALGISV